MPTGMLEANAQAIDTAQLPIAQIEDEIVSSVRRNQVTIVTSETGSGKTSLVPLMLYRAGMALMMTLPRRVAVREAAARLAWGLGSKVGEVVGYATGEDSCQSDQTKIMVVTDGLGMLQIASWIRSGKILRGEFTIILDEIHERNLAMDTLMMLLKLAMSINPLIRLVMMSATIDAALLANYFEGANVIQAPGRSFEIEDYHSLEQPHYVIAEQVRAGKSVQVFAAGKFEIDKIIEGLVGLGIDAVAVILQLHGEQTKAEQDRVFPVYAKPKVIVSTNVGETSLTIPGIQVVVDTGLEKRSEFRRGVRALATVDCSQATLKQRRGRCGRQMPGLYILCSRRSVEDRPEYPIPEIKRAALDSVTLSLADNGFDIAAMDYYDPPAEAAVAEAKALLRSLGALDSRGAITKIGRKMSHLPVDVRMARTLVEPQSREMLNATLTYMACIEVGGIRSRGKKLPSGKRKLPKWRKLIDEKVSDAWAEVRIYNLALKMTEREMLAHDIHIKHFNKAFELREQLATALGASPDHTSGGSRDQLARLNLLSMTDLVYQRVKRGLYRGTDGDLRTLERNSIVNNAEWIIGTPFDLVSLDGAEIHMITFASRIDPLWLRELMQPVERRGKRALAQALAEGKISYDAKDNNDEIIEWANCLAQRFPKRVALLTLDRKIEIFIKLLGPVVRESDLCTINLRLRRQDLVPRIVPKHLLRWNGQLQLGEDRDLTRRGKSRVREVRRNHAAA